MISHNQIKNKIINNTISNNPINIAALFVSFCISSNKLPLKKNFKLTFSTGKIAIDSVTDNAFEIVENLLWRFSINSRHSSIKLSTAFRGLSEKFFMIYSFNFSDLVA
ncbi:hypothetical protein HMPREF2619_00190 [Streptococcus sp. HMSC074B11]|nr:hypothetical protein HMPREF2619_00190 [Streptococcus sp. HMSC074B11]